MFNRSLRMLCTRDIIVHHKHPNRNTNKKRDYKKGASPNNASDKTVQEAFKEDFTKTIPSELQGVLTKEMLEELANFNSGSCISFYIPAHQGGMEVNEQQDLIAYKNALQQAEEELKKRKVGEITIKRSLKPGYALLTSYR